MQRTNSLAMVSVVAVLLSATLMSGLSCSSVEGVGENSVESDPKVAVEQLAAKWCAAFFGGDAETMADLSGEKFFFDQRILLNKASFRSEYMKMYNRKKDIWRVQRIETTEIKIRTLREWNTEGNSIDLSKDAVLGSLNLTLDDFAVMIMLTGHVPKTSNTTATTRTERAMLIIRRVGEAYEVVGFDAS